MEKAAAVRRAEDKAEGKAAAKVKVEAREEAVLRTGRARPGILPAAEEATIPHPPASELAAGESMNRKVHAICCEGGR